MVNKKYQLIYADPPWDFHNNIGGTGSNVKRHYNTMTVEQLKQMKVKDIIDDTCVCYMWTTDAYLKCAIEILEAWGFKYKTVGFIWVKQSVNNKPVAIVSPYMIKSCEICLLGTKGTTTKLIDKRQRQLIQSVRGKHSEKPDEARKRLELMYPNVNKLELFARQKFNGWDAFGNEVESDVEL